MDMTEIPKDAPKLTDRPRSDYPLSGAKTGPAWTKAWEILRDARKRGEWWAAGELAAEVIGDHPEISPDTVKNLLLSAERFGVLEKRYEVLNSRTQAHYRIKV